MKERKHILIVILALTLTISCFSFLIPRSEACLLIFEKTTEIDKYEIEMAEGICYDRAFAMILPPGGPSQEKEEIDMHPSIAEVWAPQNPNGGRNAGAKAWANGCIPNKWTSWIVDSESGWKANAEAEASYNIKITSIVNVTITVTWKVIFIPNHEGIYNYIFYGDNALGRVNLSYLIKDITHSFTLFDSKTQFTGNDGSIVLDDTGHLQWIKEPYHRWSGEVYNNAYRPMEDFEISLCEYTMDLNPHEPVYVDFSMGIQSSFENSERSSGFVGQEMVPFKINTPPNIPSIDGPTNGKAGIEYTYTFLATDSDNDDILYCIDWGDDTGEICIGPYSSGEEVTASHTWTNQDTYTIKVKSKDINDAESDWTTLEVTMPLNQYKNNIFLNWLFEIFPNAFPILRQILNI